MACHGDCLYMVDSIDVPWEPTTCTFRSNFTFQAGNPSCVFHPVKTRPVLLETVSCQWFYSRPVRLGDGDSFRKNLRIATATVDGNLKSGDHQLIEVGS